MKLAAAAIITAVILSACTDADMIAASHGQCDQIGYKPGTQQYTECVERGFRGTKAAQDQAIADTASTAVVLGILNAMY